MRANGKVQKRLSKSGVHGFCTQPNRITASLAIVTNLTVYDRT